MQLSVEGYILSYIKYGDSDVIGKIFTLENGLLTFRMYNAYSASKRKYRSLLKPLQKVEITLNYKPKQTIHSVSTIAGIETYLTLYTQVTKATIMMFLSEIVLQIVAEEHAEKSIFIFLEEKISELEKATQYALFPICFLQELSVLLGFHPSDENISLPYFDLKEGYHTALMSSFSLSQKETLLWNEFLKRKKSFLRNERHELLQHWLQYYSYHLSHFKGVQSLEVLQEIFD